MHRATINQQSPNVTPHIREEISYRKIAQIILSRWKWVCFTTLLSLTSASLYLWYSPKSYSTEASLKFEEKRSEISELINVRNVYDRSDKLLSEQFVIRSWVLLTNAINKIDYPVSFYKPGLTRDIELYPEKPIQIVIIESAGLHLNLMDFQFKAISPSRFTLSYQFKGKKIKMQYKLGDVISCPHTKFKITRFPFTDKPNNEEIIFHFNNTGELIRRVNEGLFMTENKNTNILTFTQVDENAVFARDILNAVLNEYVEHDRAQKTTSAVQTIGFIDQLQLEMSKAVRQSGTSFEQFKVNTKMLDISGTTKQVREKLDALENEKSNLKLQGLMIAQLRKDMMDNSNLNAINYNLQGISDPLLSGLIDQYNTLLLKKQEELQTFKQGATSVQEIDKQLLNIKSAFASNLEAQIEKNKKAQDFTDRQMDAIKQTFDAIPKVEKEFVNLQSDFEVNQKIYAFLSEKKLEAQISKAAVTPAVSIVDQAMLKPIPLAPVPGKTYVSAFLIGILSGIGFIFLVRLMNPYIHNQETIEALTQIPVLGIIRKYEKRKGANAQAWYLNEPRSLFSESVRAIRTNISFLAPDESCKVICITSEVSKEGKSFTAVNLAATLCLIEKRVIVIAADLRKSRLHENFNTDNKTGLSNYLSRQASLSDITFETHLPNLFFIPAGPVPPNPSELLHTKRMSDLISNLKSKFDYVIIDCAPIGLVSDAIPLLKTSDINLFIIRAGVSRYHAAAIPQRLSDAHGLANISIILNGADQDILYSRYYLSSSKDYGGHYADREQLNYCQEYLSENTPVKKWQFWKNQL